MLDTRVSGSGGLSGGAGVEFDWSLAGCAQEAGCPVIIAGGLDEGNVDLAVEMGFFGIDASSRLEVGDGNIEKDEKKVEAYVRRAREARKKFDIDNKNKNKTK